MPTYKLHYFNVSGKGELIRLAFALADQEFENIKYGQETGDGLIKWDDEARAKMPLGQMPVLEMDGEVYCQQLPIARFIARKFGLMGKNDVESLKVEMVCETLWSDIAGKGAPAFKERDEKKKEELRAKFMEELPKTINVIASWVKGDFVLGSEISLADLAIFDLQNLMKLFKLPLDYPPVLRKVCDNVKANPRIQRWIESNPPRTTFP